MMLAVGTAAGAEAPPDVGAAAMFRVDNLWVMIGAMLVFIMHLGFACVESGLTRAKNCTNILFKNTVTPAIGILRSGIASIASVKATGGMNSKADIRSQHSRRARR